MLQNCCVLTCTRLNRIIAMLDNSNIISHLNTYSADYFLCNHTKHIAFFEVATDLRSNPHQQNSAVKSFLTKGCNIYIKSYYILAYGR